MTDGDLQSSSVTIWFVGPVQVQGEAREPNDSGGTANLITVGSEIRGEVEQATSDFYTFTFGEVFFGRLSINVRGAFRFGVYDALGGRLTFEFSSGSPYRDEIGQTLYYVQSWYQGGQSRIAYTLLVVAQESK